MENDGAVLKQFVRARAWLWVAGLVASSWVGAWAVILCSGVIAFVCLREFVSILPTRQSDHTALVWSFYVILPLQHTLIAYPGDALFAFLIPVYAFLLLPLTLSREADTTPFFERSGRLQWGLMVCVYGLSHLPALAILEIEGQALAGVCLLVFLVVTVQSGAVWAWVRRTCWGRHTEVCGTGLVTGAAVGAALWWLTPFSPLESGLIGFVVSSMGLCGERTLLEIRRDPQVQIRARMIHGQGGLLDRLWPISFAAPLLFHVVRLGWG